MTFFLSSMSHGPPRGSMVAIVSNAVFLLLMLLVLSSNTMVVSAQDDGPLIGFGFDVEAAKQTFDECTDEFPTERDRQICVNCWEEVIPDFESCDQLNRAYCFVAEDCYCTKCEYITQQYANEFVNYMLANNTNSDNPNPDYLETCKIQCDGVSGGVGSSIHLKRNSVVSMMVATAVSTWWFMV